MTLATLEGPWLPENTGDFLPKSIRTVGITPAMLGLEGVQVFTEQSDAAAEVKSPIDLADIPRLTRDDPREPERVEPKPPKERPRPEQPNRRTNGNDPDPRRPQKK